MRLAAEKRDPSGQQQLTAFRKLKAAEADRGSDGSGGGTAFLLVVIATLSAPV